jgi:hypothetical protein
VTGSRESSGQAWRHARAAVLAVVVAAALSAMAPDALAAGVRTRCDVAFQLGGLGEGVSVGFLAFRVEYVRPKLFAPGPDGSVACTTLVAGSTISATNTLDNSSAGTMKVQFSSTAGATAAAPFARCVVYSAGTSVPVASDFPVVEATEARDLADAAIAPLPTVTTGEIRCGDQIPTTTTTTTTSTTLTPPTTTTTIGSTSTTAPAACGDADGDGDVKAGDALLALHASVGTDSPCTLSRCDVDASGTITASDALKILKRAVGSEVVLDCPA